MSFDTQRPLDLDEVRRKLSGAQGRALWRGLEEVVETPEFRELLDREFPQGASELSRGVHRRTFLKLLGASLGLAGLTGCGSPPKETIVPYVKQPEGLVPGKPLSYASAFVLGGVAQGVLVTSNLGRPTKIEGNPEHPGSHGATDAFAQASVLSLYDPDRAQTVTAQGRIRTWAEFAAAMAGELKAQGAVQGAGLRILTETITSPSLAELLSELLAAMPKARVHQWEPVNRDHTRAGAQLAFGEPLEVHPHLDKADVVVSLDCDFLGAGPRQAALTRAFSSRRSARHAALSLNRLYAVEGTPTLTGANADHAWCVRPSAIGAVAQAIAREIGMDVPALDLATEFAGRDKLIRAMALDLVKDSATGELRKPGSTLVLAGDGQPPQVHALVHAINEKLGNAGATVSYSKPIELSPVAPGTQPAVTQLGSLTELAQEMERGLVHTLVILGGNPVYNAPADLALAKRIEKVRFKVHLSPYRDETSRACDWHLPESHALESWGDARAADGTLTLVQPLTEPLYQTRTAAEVVALLAGKPATSAHELVKGHWAGHHEGADFHAWWTQSLHDGFVAGTREPDVTPRVRAESWRGVALPATRPVGGAREAVFRPDPTVWDGRYANSGWLQELPKPLTRLTWDNAAMIAPATAEELKLQNGQQVRLTLDGRSCIAPVWILPGHAPDAVTLPLGYGRTHAGRLGSGTGFSAYAVRSSGALWHGGPLTIEVVAGSAKLSTTQTHWSMEGRDLVRVQDAAEFAKPAHAEHSHGGPHAGIVPDLYPPHATSPNQWAMSVDLTKCTGCNACVVACQSENNIPIVGKTEVARGRAMHWIRIDRYYEGGIDEPATHHQPVMCMHCESAPCEVVCPVNATSHSEEGLNEQTYNRCVGTKYCSNNCPYKVRRFNFFQYADTSSPTLKMLANPEVTVRARGVMEKCTYCVQRIDHARVDAKIANGDGKVAEGAFQTACQAVCPAQAIVFGNLNNPESAIVKAKHEPHNYGLLTELNTRPRTTYLAKIKNPNPQLEKA